MLFLTHSKVGFLSQTTAVEQLTYQVVGISAFIPCQMVVRRHRRVDMEHPTLQSVGACEQAAENSTAEAISLLQSEPRTPGISEGLQRHFRSTAHTTRLLDCVAGEKPPLHSKRRNGAPSADKTLMERGHHSAPPTERTGGDETEQGRQVSQR
jgi:hypothetical protein